MLYEIGLAAHSILGLRSKLSSLKVLLECKLIKNWEDLKRICKERMTLETFAHYGICRYENQGPSAVLANETGYWNEVEMEK